MSPAAQYLFVYGTLRRDRSSLDRHPLLAGCEYLGNAFIRGELYEVDRYPALVAAESGQVAGELYLLTSPELTLAKLDIYEECAAQFPAPHEYIRRLRPVILSNQLRLSAWIYLYNRSIEGLKYIRSGDYARYLRENS